MNRPSYAVVEFFDVDRLDVENDRFLGGTEIGKSGLSCKP
jgi:hypothetical protein